MAPQIIYLALVFIEMLLVAYLHGKPRKPYNFWDSFIGFAITITLLAWGGFFAPLFN